MKTVLITGEGYGHGEIDRLVAAGFDIIHETELSVERMRAIVSKIDAYILGGDEYLDSSALSSAKQLKIISFVGVAAIEFIDEPFARQLGIRVFNTPGANTTAVAEHTIGLLIGLVRRLFEHHNNVKTGIVSKELSRELSSMIVGVIGMGAIGQEVARILVCGFGCTVLYFSRTRKLVRERELGMQFVPLHDLLARSDALVLQAATTEETTNLINSSSLSLAKDGLLIVNTASPKLIDPGALKCAIETGKVTAAAVDGYWLDPLPSSMDDPFGLLGLSDGRFVLTPGVAAKTRESWPTMLSRAVDNLISNSL